MVNLEPHFTSASKFGNELRELEGGCWGKAEAQGSHMEEQRTDRGDRNDALG